MRIRTSIVFAAGPLLMLAVVVVVVTLSHPPPVLTGGNSVPADAEIAQGHGNDRLCQAADRLPADTAAIRLGFNMALGTRLSVDVLAGARVITHGSRASGWRGVEVLVPLRRLPYTADHVEFCVTFGPSNEPVGLVGARSSTAVAATLNGEALPGRVRIEYLSDAHRSWWSMAAAVARRAGFGRAWSGDGTALLVLMLMGSIVSLASWLALRSLQRLPREAWLCALLAVLNAVCWSLITPPFQVTDEPDHFAYVQQLVDNASLPRASEQSYSNQEQAALEDLRSPQLRQHPGARAPIATAQAQLRLERDLAAAGSSLPSTLSAGLAGAEPPLYYLLESVPYELGSGGTLLERLQLMRFMSALMAGVTALFAFLFLREALPSVPWAWTVGGLGVALFPLLGFMSGGVTSEAMLYAVSAALFYCLARAFRRGLTRGLALATGATIAVGLLVKLNFVGLLPGSALGLAILARRRARSESSAAAYNALALAASVVAGAVCLDGVINLLSHRAAFGALSSGATLTTKHGSILGEISYIWQFYLPRLPGMGSDFAGLSTTRQVWFDGLVGLYGWLDTPFAEWVDDLALIPFALIVALCARELVEVRVALRRRVAEVVTYVLMGLGLLGLVGADAYLEFPVEVGNYAEPRYLLPLIVFWGVALALAARGAGRRWGPVLGVALVLLALAHDILSQLLVVGRYYG